MFTLEFQIEVTAKKNLTRLKKSINTKSILIFSLQNDRYHLPLCLGHIAVPQTQKLMPFLSRVKSFCAVPSIWNMRIPLQMPPGAVVIIRTVFLVNHRVATIWMV